jgi:hypothetical protein
VFLNVLRLATAPMTAREIAVRIANDYRMDVSTTHAMGVLIAKVRNALVCQRGAALKSEKVGETVTWHV